jgi:hypothetical protein
MKRHLIPINHGFLRFGSAVIEAVNLSLFPAAAPSLEVCQFFGVSS